MDNGISVIATLKDGTDSGSLKWCIQSILNQTTLPNDIVVIVEKKSKTINKVIGNLSREVANINFIIKSNGNNTSSRFIGAKYAKCDWLAFIDSDDRWVMDKLESYLEEIKRVEYASDTVIISDAYIGYINKDVPGVIDTKVEHMQIDFSKQSAYHKARLEYYPHIFSGLLVSKNYFLESFDGTVRDDWSLFFNLIDKANVIRMDKLYYIHTIDLSKIVLYTTNDLLRRVAWLEKNKKAYLDMFGVSYYDRYLKNIYYRSKKLNLRLVRDKVIDILGDENKIDINQESDMLIDFLNKHDFVACYGAGYFGDEITKFIKGLAKRIECIIVSDGQKRFTDLNGFVVKEYSEINLSDYDGIVLAMDLIKYPDMKNELRSKYLGDIFTITYEGIKTLKAIL
ncbi:Glycosyltransferase involved in cell wall bisynthesis [Selenomonas ruminantium]|uniref:Glycosyltransferase involved in cell wall bisynthesis n=1 Tax=Selenomonas ruminantium TaxID=971 RepID=A0A1I3CPE8_SELRU|nr:glycosyltransferase family 2 protein [Selenomonas ruminantium]SFH76414.1 Glycosyltransferase involved in cell wall bisynthesis [Selenomonas ruminantium]